MNKKYDYSESVIIIPFKYEGRHSSFDDSNWVKEEPINYQYFTKNINMITCDSNVAICSFYKIKDNIRDALLIPSQEVDIKLIAKSPEGQDQQYIFNVSELSLVYFTTNIGFVLINCKHPKNEDMQTIAEKMYFLCRFMTFENSKDYPMELSYIKGKATEKFSLTNIISKLMHVEKENIELFHDCVAMKATVFHRLFYDKLPENENKNLYYLRRGLYSNSSYSNIEEDNNDLILKSYENSLWSMSLQGIVSLSYSEAHEPTYNFFVNTYGKNVMRDYFFLYLLQLHERHALLDFNAYAIKNRKNIKKLISLQRKLLSFKVCCAYKAVSGESAYQSFYEKVFSVLKLDRLEADIQEIIDKVEEYENNHHDRRMNRMLALIATLGFISAFADGISLIDRLYDFGTLKAGHGVLISFIILIAISAFIIYNIKQREDDI